MPPDRSQPEFRLARPDDAELLLDFMRDYYAFDGHHYEREKARTALLALLVNPAFGFELGYAPAHRFHLARHINPELCDLWFAQPGHSANDIRLASHEVPIQWINGRRANSYQDFVVLGNRLFDVSDLDNIRWSVFGIDGGFHRYALHREEPQAQLYFRHGAEAAK
jgi:hypothetical protein